VTNARRDALLFAGALGVRAAHLLALRGGPLLRYLFIDSAFYDAFGRRLATGEGVGDGPFFMNVLYGFFLGGVYSLTGDGAAGRVAALAIQAILGAVSVVLTHRLGIAIGRQRDGMVAAVALAILGPAIFYDGALLTPSLLLFLTVATTLVAVRTLGGERGERGGTTGRGGAAPLFALGVLTGLLILGRANHLLLLPVWLVALARRDGRSALLPGLALLLGAAAVVAPVTARNLRASGEFVAVTANGGMALWAGNHEGATGIYSQPAFLSNPVPEREAEDYRAEASRLAGRELTLAGSSGFWTERTMRRWREEPGAMVRLALRKARLFFHATESQTNLSYYFARDFSRVLAVMRLHLGWILPFAIVGMAMYARAFPLVAAPIAVSLLTCVLFYISSEYRHPVAPLLLLFAAMGARSVAAWLRPGRPAAARAGAAVLVLALLVAVNFRDPFLARLQSRRVDYLNFATLAASAGELDDAERFARRSVEIDPNWPVSRLKLEEILRQKGDSAARVRAQRLFEAERFEEALAVFRQLADETPVDPLARANALNNAGLCAMQLERPAEAESLFTAARRADPTYASPAVHLGRLALALGRPDVAAAYAREALALDPEDGRARRLLARATEGGGAR
jgi:Tetratricopeptide repeat